MKPALFCLFSLLLPLRHVAAAQPDCAGLDERTCFSTRGCVLECSSGGTRQKCAPYHCRASLQECESTYAQADLTREKCEALAGCKYQPPLCFCPSPMLCVCGGGAPAQCVRQKD